MKVLVTGGAGFIGSFVTDALLAAGHAVRILDALDPQVHPGGRPAYSNSEAEFTEGDVRDRDTCASALRGVDAVVHAAAAVGVGQSLYRVEHYVDVNVRGTATLLDALAQRGNIGRLVVLTSMTAYGEGLYRRPFDGQLLRVGLREPAVIERHGWEPVCPETGERLEAMATPEDAALLARGVYALTKRYQEELAQSLGAVHDFPVVCLRMFNVYGPRQSLANPYTGVLAIFLSRLLAGHRPVVYEDGNQTRDFVSVRDVAHAVVSATTAPVSSGLVVNIGSGVPRRIGEVADLLARLVGAPELEPEITGQFRRGDVRHCTADIERAQSALGFRPQVGWEDGLTELIAAARAAPRQDRFEEAEAELRRRALITPSLSARRAGGQS